MLFWKCHKLAQNHPNFASLGCFGILRTSSWWWPHRFLMFKIDASWAEKLTKTRVSFLTAQTVDTCIQVHSSNWALSKTGQRTILTKTRPCKWEWYVPDCSGDDPEHKTCLPTSRWTQIAEFWISEKQALWIRGENSAYFVVDVSMTRWIPPTSFEIFLWISIQNKI